MDVQAPRRREPMFRVPAIVVWLLAALVAAHVAFTLLPEDAADSVLIRFGFSPGRFIVGSSSPFDLAVPFVSHIFLHGGFFHLGMNCLWLLACGPVVARRYGNFAFVVFFLLCGMAGAVAFLAGAWGSPVVVIGASGAISGLMAASIRMMPWPGVPWFGPDGPLAPLTSRPVLFFTLVWVGTNLFFGLVGGGIGGMVQEIAWQAHLGGFAAGLLLSSLFEIRTHRKNMGDFPQL